MRVLSHKLCACDAANWHGGMGAFGSARVLTQWWCARVPVVIVLACCFPLDLHGTRRPRTAVQSRVGVGPWRVARSVTPVPWHATAVLPWVGIGCDSETLVAGCNTLVCRAWSSGSLWPMHVPDSTCSTLCGIGHHRDRARPEHLDHHGYVLVTRHLWGQWWCTCFAAVIRLTGGPWRHNSPVDGGAVTGRPRCGKCRSRCGRRESAACKCSLTQSWVVVPSPC